MVNRIFYLDILDDLPVLVAIFMSVFPEYQNELIFYLSLVIGVVSSFILYFLIKKVSIENFILSFSTLEILGYVIYVFLMFGFVIYLSFSGKLYMNWIVWVYILFNFTLSILSMKETSKNEKI